MDFFGCPFFSRGQWESWRNWGICFRDSCGNKNGRDPFLRNEDFVAFYRGRPDASAAPLDKSQIETLAIQIASNFTQTSGPFQLELQSIAGLQVWGRDFGVIVRSRNRWRMREFSLPSFRVTCTSLLKGKESDHGTLGFLPFNHDKRSYICISINIYIYV